MSNKYQARKRRGLRTKAVILTSNQRPRLVVFRSSSHIYGQIVEPSEKGDLVLVSVSTLDKTIRSQLKGTKSEKAEQVGKILAERAKLKKLTHIAFDRAGFKYHGRVAALAKGAREGGLDF